MVAVRYYDEALYNKIQNWIPNKKVRILKVDETAELFKETADLSKDEPLKLPLIAISRDRSINLNIPTRRNLSYDGLKLETNTSKSAQLNAIPISLNYQIDIYTQKYDEGDAYLGEFIFNLVNHPHLEIELPYNGAKVKQSANLRVLPTVSDNSDIPERLFKGQFTRWTIELELQDAYIFNTSVKDNWKIEEEEISLEVIEPIQEVDDIDLDEGGSSSHNGFTHIAEKN